MEFTKSKVSLLTIECCCGPWHQQAVKAKVIRIKKKILGGNSLAKLCTYAYGAQNKYILHKMLTQDR